MEDSIVGAPLSDELDTGDGTGKYNVFQNGVICWTAQRGAQEVYGNLLRLWTELNAERGSLGYPLTGELGWRRGSTGGRLNSFELAASSLASCPASSSPPDSGGSLW